MKIIFPDPLIWQSGIEFGLQSLAELRSAGWNFEFSILDQGPMLEAVSFAIADYGLQAHVRWLSRRPRPWTRFDVVLIPRVAAGDPELVRQILCAGVEVVSSDPDISLNQSGFHSFPRRNWRSLLNLLELRWHEHPRL